MFITNGIVFVININQISDKSMKIIADKVCTMKHLYIFCYRYGKFCNVFERKKNVLKWTNVI